MAFDVVSEYELSNLVEELVIAEQMAVDLAESGASLDRINEQFDLVRSLHQRVRDLQFQAARHVVNAERQRGSTPR